MATQLFIQKADSNENSVRETPPVDGDLLIGRVPSGGTVEQRAGEAEAVAVVGTHHAAVGGGLLSDDQVGAGHGGEEGCD